jgi:hypothetical protein
MGSGNAIGTNCGYYVKACKTIDIETSDKLKVKWIKTASYLLRTMYAAITTPKFYIQYVGQVTSKNRSNGLHSEQWVWLEEVIFKLLALIEFYRWFYVSILYRI